MKPINWSDPVNWDDSLNASLLTWHRVVPNFAGGTVFRDLANAHDGTFENMPSNPWVTDTPPGGQAGSINFDDGTTNRINLGTWTAGVGTLGMTMSVWVRLESVATDPRFVAKGNGAGASSHDWMIGLASGIDSFRMRATRNGTTLTQATAFIRRPSDLVASGDWFNFMGVVFPTRTAGLQIYLDGENISQNLTTAAATMPSTTNFIYLGNMPGGTSAELNGRLFDARVWDRPLSDQEIWDYWQESQKEASPRLFNLLAAPVGLATAAAEGGVIPVFMNSYRQHHQSVM